MLLLQFLFLFSLRPLTLPNFLDSKKTSSKPKTPYGPSKPYTRPPPAYGHSTGPAHSHDFTPFRGGGGGGSAGYSSRPLSSYKYNSYDDYHDDGGSYDRHRSFRPNGGGGGPKSFVSMSNLDEDESDDVINIDHAAALYEPGKAGTPSYGGEGTSAPSPYRGGGPLDGADPLHPLRDYHSTGHDDEHMYAKLRHEYQTKSARPSKLSSPYYPQHQSDFLHEPSSPSVHSTRPVTDDREKPTKQKAYWRMSYVQNG